MIGSRKIRTYKVAPQGQDPFLRLVWNVLKILGGLLLFTLLMRVAGCGRPELVSDVRIDEPSSVAQTPEDWDELPPSSSDPWSNPNAWGQIDWREIPNPNGGAAIRDYWGSNPSPIVEVPDDFWQVEEDDPLGRPTAKGIVNLYLEKSAPLQASSQQIAQAFPNTVTGLISSAEEYKRLTFEVVEAHKTKFKSQVRRVFPDVLFVFDESQVKTSSVPSALLESQDAWPWRDMGAEGLWSHTMGDTSVVVAVVDNMFEVGHPEIEANQFQNWDVAGYDPEVGIEKGQGMDDESASHGTHVASLVAGSLSNGIGFGGLAPQVQLMLVQLEGADGGMTTSRLLDAMFYALSHGADVVNLSLSTYFQNSDQLAALPESTQLDFAENYFVEEGEMWDEVFSLFEQQGVLVVQAAGNDGFLASIDPMKRTGSTIMVGALDESGERTSFSNYGETVDVYAPGEMIAGAGIDGKIVKMSGTSMASPLIAGLVAALLSLEPDADLERIRGALIASFDPNTAHLKRAHAGRAADHLLANSESNV